MYPLMFSKTTPQKTLLVCAVSAWLLLALFALGWTEKTDGLAGRAAHPPVRLQTVHLQKLALAALDPSKPTLIMLVHPQCPCSRASLTELNRLAALRPNKANLCVLFLRPAGCPEAFADTDLRRQAQAIPGALVATDDKGDAARRFGAATSGETVLYAADGRLLFHGGLTGSRGHEGDNPGLSAVTAWLRGEAAPAAAPVYGCPMTADRTPAHCKIDYCISRRSIP